MSAVTASARRPVGTGRLDRFFEISARGSTVARELRGGFTTYFTMVYIVVLNPLIIGTVRDVDGRFLGGGSAPDLPLIAAATALVAGVLTILMGAVANYPVAIATGLGLNAFVAFTVASRVTWREAMGLVVLEGLVIVALVATGFRTAVFRAVPAPLRAAITVGIGLFIAIIGLVDAGIVRPGTGTPLQLGIGGNLDGWPVTVFVVGLLLTAVLYARRVPGAILIGIVVATTLALIAQSVFDIGPQTDATGKVVHPTGWSLNVPSLSGSPVATPDFGLLGQVDLVGAFSRIGVLAVVVLVFTLVLSDFFDTMGTVVGIGSQAGLLDADGNPPRTGRILFVDGAAAVAGGLGAVSSNTAYVESASGVGEGARTGLASVVTGVLFLADHLPCAAGIGGAVRGRGPRPGAGRVPDDEPGPQRCLGRRRRRHPGVPHRRPDAVHLLDHHRYRGRLHLLRAADVRHRAGTPYSPAALGGRRAVRRLLLPRPHQPGGRLTAPGNPAHRLLS